MSRDNCRAAYFFAFTLLPLSLSAASVDEIRSLLRAGDAKSAYLLGNERTLEEIGDPEFDLWFGFAAIEAGHPEQAIFALERVLLVQPQQHRARVELARAYYAIGDFDAAHREFSTVLEINPPVNVRRRVQKYLAAITQQQQARHTRVSGYIEGGVGYDSNINSATTDPNLEIPALGTAILASSDLETDDEFVRLNAALNLDKPLNKFNRVFANAAIREHNNLSSKAYDTRLLAFTAGWMTNRGDDRIRVPLSGQKILLGGESYRNLYSAGIEWSRQLDRRNQWSMFGQIGAFRYADESSLDANLKLAGIAWTQHWSGAQLVWTTSAYLGDERAKDRANFAYNGKDYVGARLGLESLRWEQHRPYASFTYQTAEYDAENPVFGVRREDNYLEIRLGWIWKFRPSWSARAELSAVKNDSTLNLYEYDRKQFYMGLRYGFE